MHESMKTNVTHRLLPLPAIQTPPALFERILAAIRRIELQRFRVRLVLCVAGFFGSIGFVVFRTSTVWNELQSTSFFAMLHLMITDPDVFLHNLSDTLYGLLEALPVQSILAFLFVTFFVVAAIAVWQSFRRLHQDGNHGAAHITPLHL